jgi:hemerythrin-like metal-binding protein
MTPADGGNSLITGNREMDEEHALQLQLLHELVQNVESGDGPAALDIFDRLEQFTSAHFLAEELLMRLHAYPHFGAHSAEHNRFLEDLKALRAQLTAGQDGAVKDEADALARRLVAHIATADNALGEFQRSGAAGGA